MDRRGLSAPGLLVRDHGRLSIGDAERLTGENRNTLKQHFRALVGDGHLTLNGAGRGAPEKWESDRYRPARALGRGAAAYTGGNIKKTKPEI